MHSADFESFEPVEKVKLGHGAGTTHKVRDVRFWAQFAVNAMYGVPIKSLVARPGMEDALKAAIAGDAAVKDAAKGNINKPSVKPEVIKPNDINKPIKTGALGSKKPGVEASSRSVKGGGGAGDGAEAPLGKFDQEITALDSADILNQGKARRLSLKIASAYYTQLITADEYRSSMAKLHSVIASAKADRRTDSISDAIHQAERLGFMEGKVPKTVIPTDYKSSKIALRDAKTRADMDVVGKDLQSLFRRGKLTAKEYEELHDTWMDRRQKSIAEIYADDIESAKTIADVDRQAAPLFDLLKNRTLEQEEYEVLHALYLERRDEIASGKKRAEDRGESSLLGEEGDEQGTEDGEGEGRGKALLDEAPRKPRFGEKAPQKTDGNTDSLEPKKPKVFYGGVKTPPTREELPSEERRRQENERKPFTFTGNREKAKNVFDYLAVMEDTDWGDEDTSSRVLNELTSDYELGHLSDDEFKTLEREFVFRKLSAVRKEQNGKFWDKETLKYESDQNGNDAVVASMDSDIEKLNRRGIDEVIDALQDKEEREVLPSRQKLFLDKAVAKRTENETKKREGYFNGIEENKFDVPSLTVLRKEIESDQDISEDLREGALEKLDERAKVSQLVGLMRSSDNADSLFRMYSGARDLGLDKDLFSEIAKEFNERNRELSRGTKRKVLNDPVTPNGLKSAKERNERATGIRSAIYDATRVRDSIPILADIERALRDGEIDFDQYTELKQRLNQNKKALYRRNRLAQNLGTEDFAEDVPEEVDAKDVPETPKKDAGANATEEAPKPSEKGTEAPKKQYDTKSREADIAGIGGRRDYFRVDAALDDDLREGRLDKTAHRKLKRKLYTKAQDLELDRIEAKDKFRILALNSSKTARLAQLVKSAKQARESGELADADYEDFLRVVGTKVKMLGRTELSAKDRRNLDSFKEELRGENKRVIGKLVDDAKNTADVNRALFELERAKNDGTISEQDYDEIKDRGATAFEGFKKTSTPRPRARRTPAPQPVNEYSDPDVSGVNSAEQATVRRALDTLQKVIPNVDLSNVKFREMSSLEARVSAGKFRVSGDGEEVIELAPGRVMSAEKHSVVFHEIGHMLDWRMGTPSRFESTSATNDPHYKNLRDAVKNSEYYKNLIKEMQGAREGDMKDYLGYLSGDEEIFARMFSQNVARNSGDPELIREFEEYAKGSKRSKFMMVPWDDFEPIGRAMDDIMDNLAPRRNYGITSTAVEAPSVSTRERDVDLMASVDGTTDLRVLDSIKMRALLDEADGLLTEQQRLEISRRVDEKTTAINKAIDEAFSSIDAAENTDDAESLYYDLQSGDAAENYDFVPWIDAKLATLDNFVSTGDDSFEDPIREESYASYSLLMHLLDMKEDGNDDGIGDFKRDAFNNNYGKLNQSQRAEVAQRFYLLDKKSKGTLTDEEEEVLSSHSDRRENLALSEAYLEGVARDVVFDPNVIVNALDIIEGSNDRELITPTAYRALYDRLYAIAKNSGYFLDEFEIGTPDQSRAVADISEEILRVSKSVDELDYVMDSIYSSELTTLQKNYLSDVVRAKRNYLETGRSSNRDQKIIQEFDTSVRIFNSIKGEIRQASTRADLGYLTARILASRDEDETLSAAQADVLERLLAIKRFDVAETDEERATDGRWGKLPVDTEVDVRGNILNEKEVEESAQELEELAREDFEQAFSIYGDVTGTYPSVYSKYNPMTSQLDILIEENGMKVDRIIDFNTKTAHHSELTLEDWLQNRGIATQANGYMYDVYKELGLEKVKVYANVDVGGYTWTRQGYDWDVDKYNVSSLNSFVNGQLDLMERSLVVLERDSFDSEIDYQTEYAYKLDDDLVPVTQAEYDAVLEEIARVRSNTNGVTQGRWGLILPDNYPTPLDLSQIGRRKGMGKDDVWVGKSAMLGSDWYGLKNLTTDKMRTGASSRDLVSVSSLSVAELPENPPYRPRPLKPAFDGILMQDIMDDAEGDPSKLRDILKDKVITTIDFETDGGSGWDKIPIQVAVSKTLDGKLLEEPLVLFMNPEVPLGRFYTQPKDPEKVLKDPTGKTISDEFLATQPSIEEAFSELADYLGKDPLLVAAHNADFDLSILNKYMPEGQITVAGRIDTVPLAKDVLQGGPGTNNLEAVARKFGLGENAVWHDAKTDIEFIPQIIDSLLERMAETNNGVNQLDVEKSWQDYLDEKSDYKEYEAKKKAFDKLFLDEIESATSDEQLADIEKIIESANVHPYQATKYSEAIAEKRDSLSTTVVGAAGSIAATLSIKDGEKFSEEHDGKSLWTILGDDDEDFDTVLDYYESMPLGAKIISSHRDGETTYVKTSDLEFTNLDTNDPVYITELAELTANAIASGNSMRDSTVRKPDPKPDNQTGRGAGAYIATADDVEKTLNEVVPSGSYDDIKGYLDSMGDGARIHVGRRGRGYYIWRKTGNDWSSTAQGTVGSDVVAKEFSDDPDLRRTIKSVGEGGQPPSPPPPPEPDNTPSDSGDIGKKLSDLVSGKEAYREYVYNSGVGSEFVSEDGFRRYVHVEPGMWRVTEDIGGDQPIEYFRGPTSIADLLFEVSGVSSAPVVRNRTPRGDYDVDLDDRPDIEIGTTPEAVRALSDVFKYKQDNEDFFNDLRDNPLAVGIKNMPEMTKRNYLESLDEMSWYSTMAKRLNIQFSDEGRLLSNIWTTQQLDILRDAHPIRGRQASPAEFVIRLNSLKSYTDVIAANYSDVKSDGSLGDNATKSLNIVTELGIKVDNYVEKIKDEINSKITKWDAELNSVNEELENLRASTTGRQKTQEEFTKLRLLTAKARLLSNIIHKYKAHSLRDQSKIFRKALDKIRLTGLREGSNPGFYLSKDRPTTSDKQLLDGMIDALGFYPTDWTDKERYDTIKMIPASQAGSYYSDVIGFGMGPGAPKDTQVHEIGHMMERENPSIRSLEWALWWKRSAVKKPDGSYYIPNPIPWDPNGRGLAQGLELVEDEWSYRYAGLVYGEPLPIGSWEIFTTGVQVLLGGRTAGILDDEHRRFVMGVLSGV